MNAKFAMHLFYSSAALLPLQAEIACADERSSLVLEEVLVTAQKRAENLQDVPVSVSALNAQELESLKLRGTTEIAAQIPNVHIQALGGDSQPVISIRGISMSDYSQNQSGPVAIYVDEIYKGPTPLISMQLYDLERIEVLRGPQGTLYGKNTTGGAVNFYTKRPDFSSEGYLTVGAGDYSRLEAQGAYQMALVEDKLAARIAFTAVKADGYVENKLEGKDDLSEIEEYAGRISLLFQPSENLEMMLRLHKGESGPPRTYGVLAVPTTPLGIGFTGYTREGLDYYETEANHVQDKVVDNEGVSLTVNWDIGDYYSLTSITSYDEGDYISDEDSDGSPFEILSVKFDASAEQVTQDLRITSSYDGPFNFIAGVYYADEEINYGQDFRFFLDFVEAPTDCLIDFVTGCIYGNNLKQTRDSYAAYLHTTYDLTDDLTLTLGLRYTDDETEVSDYQSNLYGSDGSFLGPVFPPQPAQDIGDTDWSGKIGLDYQVGEDTMVYMNFSNGYRAGAFNGQALFDPSEITAVDPEEVDAWEAGIKTQLLDNRLQLNAAAFYYDYTNQQFLEVQPDLTQILRNAGESEIYGLELELMARLTEGLTIQAGLGLLDAEYTELELGGADLSGNKLIGSPELTFNTAIDYEFRPTPLGRFVLRFDTSYTDDLYFDAANTERIAQDGYWISNARLSFHSASDSFSAAVWVKNMADEEYSAWAAPLDDFGYDFIQRGVPRTYGVEGTWRF